MFCFCPIHLNICIIKSSLTLGNKHFLWSVPLFSWYEPHILWRENERTYRVYFTLFAMWHVIWFNLWSKTWKLYVTCMQQLMSLWLNVSLCFCQKICISELCPKSFIKEIGVIGSFWWWQPVTIKILRKKQNSKICYSTQPFNPPP